MATVTGLTADRMLAIEAASVVDGDVVGDDLILTKHDGSQINAGSVRGPQGDPGPISSDLVVVTTKPVLDVGLTGQVRAGRQLTAADFTNMGLQPPLGLWNLSDLTDVSGSGHPLTPKNATVLGAIGINGIAATAAQFRGASGTPANDPVLYIPDTGAADPFRIKTGSWGCWFRTAKRGTVQHILSKVSSTIVNDNCYEVTINNSNVISVNIWNNGIGSTLNGITDVADDRWHFVVVTYDGTTALLIVDGYLETITKPTFGLMNSAGNTSPFNVGGACGTSGNNVASPFWGRVDEAFITNEVLTEDQIRNLYCVKIPHTLGAVPTRVSLNVRRRRRGATLTVSDFSAQPLRLYNFSAGSLGDEGTNNATLTNSGAAPTINGADGSSGNAFQLNGSSQWLSATNTGLPASTATRSFGCWFKMPMPSGNGHIMLWGGAHGVSDVRLMHNTGGLLIAANASPGDVITGPFVADGQWHFVVVVEDNTLVDAKRKLYLDGRLVGTSNNMGTPVVDGSPNKFRIGVSLAGGEWFAGTIDTVFVCGYTMSADEVFKLYAKGSQALPPSPKNVGDHIEGMTSTDLLAIFDTLESQHQVDLGVA